MNLRQTSKPMAKKKKVRIVSLGGIGEIGKNCNLVEYGDTAILVDAGLTFPDAHLLGVDLVVPDFTYLLRNRSRIKTVILTHGHEDHIGALPFLLQDMVPPVIYGTSLTIGLLRSKFPEYNIPDGIPLEVIEAGDKIPVNSDMQVETFHVAHSIPDGLALGIHTPAGVVLFSGDFKLDRSPIDHLPTDMEGIERMARENEVLALLVDTTNIERPGWTGSESEVGPALAEHYRHHQGRILVTTFASNIHRIQQTIDLAKQFRRRVFLAGRTMLKNAEMARELGYLHIPPNLVVEPNELDSVPPRRLVILATGSQGEPMSALSQMSRDEHRFVTIRDDDLVIFSASPIPGNETYIYTVINDLFRLGAEVVYGLDSGVHVSGHGSRQEIKKMVKTAGAKYLLPVHSQFRHQMMFKKLAEDWGQNPKNIITIGIGDVVEMNRDGWQMSERVKAGATYIDGITVGGVSTRVVQERRMLAEDGVMVFNLVVDPQGEHILSGPHLSARGFPQERQNPQLYAELREMLADTFFHNRLRAKEYRAQVRNNLANALQHFVFKKLGLNPTVVGTVLYLDPHALAEDISSGRGNGKS